ncbi:beta-Ala-His dipeptidase [Erysipelothrix urinaevulpis]|uniref:beta-Ala-His dipeptidase n=1 Tax=Erysipelothrix urinaevulpis TaxID=2683717 RepID=UPI001357F5CC|nr:beta-Ala-His dipeptidase [Erysipelothrix urinaevulpis]
MAVMKYFEEISKIPRASFDEKRISDTLKEFAIERNLKFIQDDMYNIIIFKEASKGYEKAPVVMLQSHIDMVAEKNKDSDHDFDHDPIELIVKDGVLWANNTTLGADNGVGVAYMMALLDQGEAHPALECVFTVQEETGLTGAAMLDTSMLKSELCVGLDSSGDTETCVSTSGGVRGLMEKEIQFESGSFETLKIEVRGLLGGHSGGEIDQERANANKLAAILLHHALKKDPKTCLVDFDGGLKMNAITREADLEIAVSDSVAVESELNRVKEEMLKQYEFSDAGLTISISQSTSDKKLNQKDTLAIKNLLFMLPYGVIQKSKAIDDLVITSANIGTIRTESNRFEVTVSLRATQAYVLDVVMDQVAYLAQVNGFEIDYSSHYPGWDFDSQSKFRQRLKDVYRDIRGSEMLETATHGGMELGIWKDKMNHLDIISFGPNMYDIHTPNEHLDIESFEKTYILLEKLLESLKTY